MRFVEGGILEDQIVEIIMHNYDFVGFFLLTKLVAYITFILVSLFKLEVTIEPCVTLNRELLNLSTPSKT